MGLEIAERTLGGWEPAGARTRSEEESSTAVEQREGRDGSGKQRQLNCLKSKVSVQNPAQVAQRS